MSNDCEKYVWLWSGRTVNRWGPLVKTQFIERSNCGNLNIRSPSCDLMGYDVRDFSTNRTDFQRHSCNQTFFFNLMHTLCVSTRSRNRLTLSCSRGTPMLWRSPTALLFLHRDPRCNYICASRDGHVMRFLTLTRTSTCRYLYQRVCIAVVSYWSMECVSWVIRRLSLLPPLGFLSEEGRSTGS